MEGELGEMRFAEASLIEPSRSSLERLLQHPVLYTPSLLLPVALISSREAFNPFSAYSNLRKSVLATACSFDAILSYLGAAQGDEETLVNEM